MLEKFIDGGIQAVVPTNEKGYLFMDILEHSNCIIQRYYWRSKMDPEVIEELEPKIFDAYNMVILAKGDILNLVNACILCNMKYEVIEKLPSTYIPYTEDEIKATANKFLMTI